MLQELDAANNQIRELPRSIAELNASCTLDFHGNPLNGILVEEITEDIAEWGIPAIKAYFECLDYCIMKELRREEMAASECENADTSLSH